MVIETFGHAETTGHGRSRGVSVSEGLSEVFVPTLEWLPSARYSLDELMHRAQGMVTNLQPRSCVVKITGEAPFVARTADLVPAFRSVHFKTLMLPRFLTTISKRSPYLAPAMDIDAQIAQRKVYTILRLPLPEPNFSPEPFPFLDSPHEFARDFIAKKRSNPAPKPTQRSKTKKPPTKTFPPLHRHPGGLMGITIVTDDKIKPMSLLVATQSFKRLERPQSAPAFKLQERDVAIVRAVAKYRSRHRTRSSDR